jgi:hypothetical protein
VLLVLLVLLVHRMPWLRLLLVMMLPPPAAACLSCRLCSHRATP